MEISLVRRKQAKYIATTMKHNEDIYMVGEII